jgi:uncharacterized damage-inducible protein DinB
MPYPVLQNRADILRMLDELSEYRQKILAACAKLTPAQLADPVIPGTWSLFKNLQHLAWAEDYMVQWIKKRPAAFPREQWPSEPPADLDAIRTAFDEAHATAIAFLKGNADAVLTEPCKYGRDARQETVGGVFFHLVEHEIHHRAFILYKLRALQGAG